MMDKFIPKDIAAREQIVNDLDSSLLVEAAAGTGKTTLLIQRILNLIVMKQASLTKVVAITFTEKAAGELKQRLRLSLEAEIHQAPSSENALLFRNALSELDLMPVTTIHGFCSDLIRQLPVEAGIDPDAKVLDDANEAALKDEFWDAWLTSQLSKECDAFQPLFDLDLPLKSNRSGLSLRELFDELTQNQDTIDTLHVTAQPLHEILARVQDISGRINIGIGLLEYCASQEDKLAIKIVELREWTGTIKGDDTTQLLRQLAEFKSFKTARLGNKANWQTGRLEAAREWAAETVEFLESIRKDLFSFHALRMIEWLKDAAREFHAWKLQRGLIGFQDLLVLARDLLHASHPARAFFKERYEYLLVDEFQDTDPLQTEIVFYLAEKRGEYADDWQKVSVAPGKLFIVGDPKQSIYRFRRADLELYKRVKEKLEHEGEFIKINASFRSVRPLIEEVNAIFAPQMKGEVEGHYEPEYVAMEPVREAIANQPSIELIPPPTSGRFTNGSSTQTAQAEAAAIAEYIRALVDGKQTIEEDKEQRPVCWGDIAVLLRTWTNTYLLEREFRARDIPFELATDRFFGERVEITALRTILCALDNSFDEVYVVGALRSSFLGCSDDELFRHRINGGSFNYLKSQKTSGHPKECFQLLRELHAQKQNLTVSELMDEILSRTHGAELLALKPYGVERIDALRKLTSFVRALEQDGTRSLHQIIRQLGEDDFMKSAGAGDGGETAVNCVRVMTFFKAKGLEFPVVCLYDLGHGQNRSTNIIYDRDQGKLEFAMNQNLCTAGFSDAKELEQARQDYEEMRLLYVAMTRARDSLAIPLYWLSKSKKHPVSFQKYLEAHFKFSETNQPLLPNDRACCVDTSGFDLNKPPKEKLVMDLNVPFSGQEERQSTETLDAWERRRNEAASKLRRSALYGRASAPTSAKYASIAFNEKSDGAAFGSFVHDILERIELPGGSDLKYIIHDLRRQQRISDVEAQQAETLIRGMLTTQFFTERVAKSDQLFRELPFAVMLDDVLYEGKMDLVFMEQGQAVIVDYKTNHCAPDDLIEKYGFQASIYARALEQIIGKNIREVILYHLRSNTPIHLSRADLKLD
jgi:ATP-dependent helicase/nuclease subunit A